MKLSESGRKLLNDQAVIRWMFPACTAKWLARLMGISLRSARFWSEQTVPVYRRQEMYQRLLEEYHAKRAWEEEHILPELLKGAGLVHEVEIMPKAGAAAAAADLARAVQGRVEAAVNWIEGE